MINSFQDWKDICQKEFNRLAGHHGVVDLTETGKAKLRMYRAFLNIADWSDSATEAVEWIDGKCEMDPEIRGAIDTPLAEQLIADIRQLAKEEQVQSHGKLCDLNALEKECLAELDQRIQAVEKQEKFQREEAEKNRNIFAKHIANMPLDHIERQEYKGYEADMIRHYWVWQTVRAELAALKAARPVVVCRMRKEE